jgi:uncharacterized repeat protein (TIGR01451 family)
MGRSRRSAVTAILATALFLAGGVPAAAAVDSGFGLYLLERPDVAVGRTPVEPRIEIHRWGAPATGVVLTADLAAMADTVEVAGVGPDCERTGATVRCEIGDMALDEMREVHPVRVVAVAGAPAGPAGRITFRVSDAAASAQRTDQVRVLTVGPDIGLTASPASEFDGVLVLPMDVTNHGDVPVRISRLVLGVPAGLRIGDYEHGRGCVTGDGVPARPQQPGPLTLDCTYDWDIPPGRTFPILESGSSPPRFFAVLGPNTPGPADYRVTAEMILAVDEPNKSDNAVSWTIAAPANRIDVGVTTKTVRSGDTATVTWTVRNRGPSDATGRTVDIVPPSGTTLLPSPDCVTRGGGLRCRSEKWLVANASATGQVQLRITGAPGTNGTVTVGGTGPSAERRPSDNRAAIVFDGTPGDGDGTLPITGPGRAGPDLAGLGAGALLLGALLLFAARRRATRAAVPADR